MMTFDVEEKEGKVIVFVQIPHHERQDKGAPRQRFATEDVVLELASRGVEHGEAIQTATVKNWREHTRQGTWIFEKKTIKPLDKPAEKVILTKENKPAPKKRKSRAKKKTSK
jgi:hypothetical protein